PESIIMVRQDDGSVKAFYNVCQHRGARLTFNEDGHNDEFACPYHGWRWDKSGTLNWAQDPEDFPQGDPCDHLQLQEIRCEEFAGFVWINMDPDCESLKDYLGPVWDEWQAYEIEGWKRYQALTCHMPCNWKVIQDNFNESYHLPAVHPESDTFVEENYRWTQFDLSDEGHNRMIMRAGMPSHAMMERGEEPMREPLISVLKMWELNPEDFEGRERECREALQQAKRELGPKRGYTHYNNLRDEQLSDFYHYTIFPNFAVSITSDGFHFLRSVPHPTDPNKCIFDNWFYASEPEGVETEVMTPAGPVARGEEVERDVFNYGEQSLGFAIDQDMGITTGQQLGFRSRGFTGVYLSHQERRIRRYHEVIDEYIDGKRPMSPQKKMAAE
ncbi:MAG: aromatic ring-hydroxylating dioxygenase subunit alpha, partial [Alphaproteobacteria bacterium]|nr:aromatic ring-hydroxylating dioxygenase subunit alpha [Alphaproteobacteria bacterium]